MAITPIQQNSPVARTRTKESKAGRTLGGLGAIAGGIAGAFKGGAAGAAAGSGFGPYGAAVGGALGGIAGLAGGVTAGQSGGQFIGERIQPTRNITENVPGRAGQLQLSPNGKQIAESLQILQQMPPEIAQPHSRSLTAALMADLAQTNSRGA